MKELEKIKEVLEELKEELESDNGDLKERKEQNQKNISNLREKIRKEYLDEKTEGIIFLNDIRCSTVGNKNALLTLFACLIDSLKKNIPRDEIVHSFVGGMALKDSLELDKEEVKEIIEDLKKYL